MEQSEDELRKQLRTRVEPSKRTICEIHREMFDLLDERFPDPKIIALLEEAYFAAKKIDAKLRQYAFDYPDDWYKDQTRQAEQEKLVLRRNRKP